MTAQTWNSIAELLGIASSAVLLIPAIALNRHLRDVHDTEKALVASTTELFKAVGRGCDNAGQGEDPELVAAGSVPAHSGHRELRAVVPHQARHAHPPTVGQARTAESIAANLA